MVKEFDARVAEWQGELRAAVRGLYGEEADAVADDLVSLARDHADRRRKSLVALDRRRAVAPYWYQSHERVGYMAYVDRFGGDLAGVRARIPYLVELGVDTLHLLSLLHPRDGENDGGYAVRDYLRPDPRLGTSDDLAELVDDLRDHGISLCLDFVLNHTSDDHEWAVAAMEGSDYHRSLYRTFADRTEPDRWEQTLPEVFPNLAPGNFTWNEPMQRWVWTTFREFQWDLDWSNPDVMREVVDLALSLANLGVEILRLDAIAFTWKRSGTNCQNQPEAHLIAQALRAALAIGAPATVLLAEAIVAPDDLVGYLGRHDVERRECELAYHNQLMVQGWSMLASGRTDLARHALARLPAAPARATWFTYVRCHDDIGWAIDDVDASAVGLGGPAHREFLASFYRGDFWGSFARGLPFGTNAETGDERTSGSAAALAGVVAALASADDDAREAAVDRILLLYAIAFGYGGTPIVYMGDELCQSGDPTWQTDPERRTDSRWAHRPRFDDELLDLRNDTSTPTGRLWHGIRHLVATRRATPQLDDHAATVTAIDVGAPSVFAWHRRHPRFGDLVGLANVGDEAATVRPLILGPGARDRLRPGEPSSVVWSLAPRHVRWLVDRRGDEPTPAPGRRP